MVIQCFKRAQSVFVTFEQKAGKVLRMSASLVSPLYYPNVTDFAQICPLMQASEQMAERRYDCRRARRDGLRSHVLHATVASLLARRLLAVCTIRSHFT